MQDPHMKDMVHHHLIQESEFLKMKDRMNEDELRAFVDRAITEVCRRHHIQFSMDDRISLLRELVSAAVSLGPLRPLMEDPTITEVMVNGANNIYIQRNGKILKSQTRFVSAQHLVHTIQKIMEVSGSNRRVDESSPYVDFSMPDGSRVNVIIPPCSLVGPVVTIRKFLTEIATAEDLLQRGMMDKPMMMLLSTAVQAKLNIVFCGATGTGKTTTLNVMSRYIAEHERIVTIEDTPELRLKQEHVVSLVSKPANLEGKGIITIRDLFINSLRMRPDRIIIGEVRSDEMLDLIQSISSGHSGSLSIVHADSPEDCFNRMVTMMLMTGIRLSTREVQRQVARALDLIVHIELFHDGVRRVTCISEPIYREEAQKVELHPIFRFEYAPVAEGDDHSRIVGSWVLDKTPPRFLVKYARRNVRLPEGFFHGT